MIYFSEKMHDCHAFHIREDEPIPEEFTVHAHMMRIEIFCVVSGKLKYHVEGNTYYAQPGDLIASIPGETHWVELDPSAPYERMVVIFEPKMLSGMDPNGDLTRLLLSKQPGIRNIFKAKEAGSMAWSERMGLMMRPAPQPRLNILATLSLVLQQMITALSQDREASPSDGLKHRLLRYINENLSQPLSLDLLCQHFYISRAHLCRVFRSAAGTSVGNYITTKRMLLAKQLICQGSKPTQIFQQCGYREYSSFYRAYAKFHGHPPKDDLRSPVLADDDTISIG